MNNETKPRPAPSGRHHKVLCMRILPICLVAMVFGAGAASGTFGSETDSPKGGARVPVQTLELPNGMRLLMVHRPEMTTVSAGWVAHVGSANERPGITGLAHFFEHMMFKGTPTIGTTDATRDAEILIRQEEVQEKIRAVFRDQRRRWRLGEINDPYDPDNRPPQLVELQHEFDELIAEQRSVMVKDEFDKIYTQNGASGLNAFTNEDVTVYFITVPANKLELWFWMESDRLANPVFREFYSERDVVYEERRLRTESTPTGKFDELVNSMFWQSHPYSWPVVGWPSDLRVISKEQADDFFATYYAPNNLTAVLVGNFEPDEAKNLAERYFAWIPRGAKEPPDVVTLEMEQVAEKRMHGECDCQPQIQVLYHTVPFRHRDSYVLDIMAGLLNGRTGRLYKAMVEGSEIASSAQAFQDSKKYGGSFGFAAETKGESTPQQLEEGWQQVLAQLQTEPVPERELRKVKNREIADVFRRLESPLFLMIQLALYDGLGDYTYLNTLQEGFEGVTAEDIRRVAGEYFSAENRVVAHYQRKAGTAAPGVPDELADLPPEMKQQVMAQIKQLEAISDVEQLRQALSSMEGQADSVPPDYKKVFGYLIGRLRERIAALSEGGQF